MISKPLKKGWCCCTLQTGNIVVGVINLILGLIGAVYGIHGLATGTNTVGKLSKQDHGLTGGSNSTSTDSGDDGGNDTWFSYWYMSFFFLACVVMIFLACCHIYGAGVEHVGCVLAGLAGCIVGLVLTIIHFFVYLCLVSWIWPIFMLVLIAYWVYAILLVVSYYMELEGEGSDTDSY